MDQIERVQLQQKARGARATRSGALAGLGFDTETKPLFLDGAAPHSCVCLSLQLATSECAALFRLDPKVPLDGLPTNYIIRHQLT